MKRLNKLPENLSDNSKDISDIHKEAKDFRESIKSIKGMRRKQMKVSENLDNIISTQNKQIIEPEHAAEAQTPVYADAMRNLKKTGDLRDEKINDDIENATNHDFEIGKEKKLTLEESLQKTVKNTSFIESQHFQTMKKITKTLKT